MIFNEILLCLEKSFLAEKSEKLIFFLLHDEIYVGFLADVVSTNVHYIHTFVGSSKVIDRKTGARSVSTCRK